MLKKAVKILVTLLFLGYLILYVVDWPVLWSNLKEIDVKFYLAAYALNLLGIFVSSKRWNTIMRSKNIVVDSWYLIKLYFIGIMYNTVLPGTVGGDAVKIAKLKSKLEVDVLPVASTVILERFIGLLLVYLAGVMGLIFTFDSVPQEVMGMLGLFLGSLTLIFLIFFYKRLCYWGIDLMVKLLPFLGKFKEKIVGFYDELQFFNKGNKSAVIQAVSYSVIFFFVCYVGATYFLLMAFHGHVPYIDLLTVLPVVNLIVMLPVSFGGVGVRESLLVLFLGFYGVTPEVAVSIGMMMLSFRLLNSVWGAAFNISLK